jgi:MerR family transcriptional regulator, light-induced transcriptional regulator
VWAPPLSTFGYDLVAGLQVGEFHTSASFGGGGKVSAKLSSMAGRNSREVTLEEAAELLQVHYMTVYKYVRTGRIRAERHPGRWVIDSRDLEAFHDKSAALRTRSAPGRVARPAQRWAARAKRLMARMVAGDGPGSWSIIESALVSGSPADMYLRLLAPALKQVGDSWSRGDVSIADEHRATAVALGLTGRLSPLFAHRGPSRAATVLLAGAEGDPHVVPLLMVADALRAEGWSIVNLGADVPRADLLATARATANLQAVGISLSSERTAARTAKNIRALRAECPDVAVLLGGPAATSVQMAQALGADGWAPDLAGAAKLVNDLVAAPEPRLPDVTP